MTLQSVEYVVLQEPIFWQEKKKVFSEHFTDMFSINVYATFHLHKLTIIPHYGNYKCNSVAITIPTKTYLWLQIIN